MSEKRYDVVIVGTGPAGIQAAIHASRKKTSVLMLGRIENSALCNAHIENYACVAGVTSGKDLLDIGIAQVKGFGTDIIEQDVLKILKQDDFFVLETEDSKQIKTHAIIFCMGISKKKLKVKGEKELIGRGVSYCVDCDANFYKGATVAVVGNKSAAVDGALTLLDYAAKVYLVSSGLDVTSELEDRLKNSDVEVLEPCKVKSIIGENSVTAIQLEDQRSIEVEGIFIELGSKGALELATQIDVQLDSEFFKYINTNRKCETNIAGVYAAGDITGPPFQMAKAVGEGCVAGMEAAIYARKQKQAQGE